MSLVDEDVKTITARLSAQIGKSIKQTGLLLKETMVLLNREQTTRVNNRLHKDTKYEYAGVLDSHTSPICREFLAKDPMTMKEWKKLKSDVFINGGHPFCRHSLIIAEEG